MWLDSGGPIFNELFGRNRDIAYYSKGPFYYIHKLVLIEFYIQLPEQFTYIVDSAT